MTTTLDQVRFDSLFCLFKGEPGTRKSTCALSFPKPIYYFDWDRKVDALVLPAQNWKYDFKQIARDPYSDWNAGLSQLERFAIRCPYKTLVIDSITSCADAINKQTSKVKKSDGKGGMVAGIAVNSIEDYKAEESALQDLVSMCKDIKENQKVNIVLIAHVIQKEMKSADGKTHMARLLVTAGKGIAQKIPAYCSEVYHFNIKGALVEGAGGQYALKTTHTGDDFARSSLPLPEEIVFGNDELYTKYMLPAINKMPSGVTSESQVVKSI